jgi:hypothetical protein
VQPITAEVKGEHYEHNGQSRKKRDSPSTVQPILSFGNKISSMGASGGIPAPRKLRAASYPPLTDAEYADIEVLFAHLTGYRV